MPLQRLHFPRLSSGCLRTAIGAILLPVSWASTQAGTPAVNDDFANGTVIPGPSATISTYNNFATTEPGEPRHGGRDSGNSLWWIWTAPSTGWANFSTTGSDSPVLTAIYVGQELKGLSSLGVTSSESLSIPVQEGVSYRIAIALPKSDAGSPSLPGLVLLTINGAPAVLSSSLIEAFEGGNVSYLIRASNGATRFAAENLPAGLSLNPYTGAISGTVRTTGTFDFLVKATGPGGTGTATLRLLVRPPVSASSPLDYSSGEAVEFGYIGAKLSSNFWVRGRPSAFSAVNLPPGISFNVDNGSIGTTPTLFGRVEGIPQQAGVSKIKLSFSNISGSIDGYTVFQIREKLPLPLLSSNAVAYGTVGTYLSYSLAKRSVENDDRPLTYEFSNLPPGLYFDGSNYVRGTPTEAGTYEVPLKITNATGDSVHATLTFIIAPLATSTPTPSPSPTPEAAPTITSAAAGLSTVGSAFSFSISATNQPASFSATGLPPGLTLDASTGRISGTATTAGTYPVTLSATNSLGTTMSNLLIVIDSPPTAPRITTACSAFGVAKQSFSYTITADNDFSYRQTSPIDLAVSGLPTGLTFYQYPDTYGSSYATGYIIGTPTTPGTYRVPITATSAGLTTTGTLTIVIAEAETLPPTITSAACANGSVGSSLTYTITASVGTNAFDARDLPPGLVYDSSSHAISGKPTTAGTFETNISASNAIGTATARVTFVISPVQPVSFSDAAAVEGAVGKSMSRTLSVSNPPGGTVTFQFENLPPGLAASERTISGTPTAAGTYATTVSATNAGGTAQEILTFIIRPAGDPPPSITSESGADAIVGNSFSYTLYGSNNPTSYSFGNLPPGLSASGAILSGKPTEPGVYEIPLLVSNASGEARGTLRLRVAALPPAPVFSSAGAIRGYSNSSMSFTFGASNATSFQLSGTLPAGLTFNSTSFQLSGTPTQSGVFPLEITARGPGGSTTTPVTLFVDATLPLPLLTTPVVIPYYLFSPVSVFLSATNSPSSYTFTNLPTTLTYSPFSRTITGTLASTGAVPVKITASNATGSQDGIVTFNYSSTSLSFYGAAVVQASVGDPFAYTFTSYPSGSSRYESTTLPDGLVLNSQTGAITGTPTTPGTAQVKITAKSGPYPSISGTVTIVVTETPPLPILKVSSDIRGKLGSAFETQLYASDNPRAFAISGLPPGLTVNSTNGRITGTPTAAGVYPITIRLTNASGTSEIAGVITIASAPPTLVYRAGQELTLGVSRTISPSTASYATLYEATGLPPGLVLDPKTAYISGTPTALGSYPVTVTASSINGSDTAKFVVNVVSPPTPVVSSYSTMKGNVGTSLSFTLSAAYSPGSYSASNLPPGLSLNRATGAITGTPTTAGTYPVSISATNSGGTGTATILFTIEDRAPSLLTSGASAYATRGSAVQIRLNASESNSTFTASDLPPGLTLTGSYLAGTPSESGDFLIPIHVLNGNFDTPAYLSLHVADTPQRPPLVTTPLTISATAGGSFSAFISTANGEAVTPDSPLPAGVTFDSKTSTVSGYADKPGIYPINFTASNSIGNTSATVTLVVAPATSTVLGGMSQLVASVGKEYSQSLGSLKDLYFSSFPPYWNYLPSLTAVRGLPPGLYFDNEMSSIAGSPTQAGDFPLEFVAHTEAGDQTTRVTLHVSDGDVSAPSFTTSSLTISASTYLNALGAVGSPFTFTVWPVGVAREVSATGLPPGLTLTSAPGTSNNIPTLYGKISGTPTATGEFPVRITFRNGDLSATAVVTITVPERPSPPSFSGSWVARGTAGKAFTYYLGGSTVENNAATGFTATGLPPGLAVDSETARIKGSPSTAGTFPVDITATNAGGDTHATVLFVIEENPEKTSILSGHGSLDGVPADGTGAQAQSVGYAGETFSYTMETKGGTRLTIPALPAGLSLRQISTTQWLLAGTPSESGLSLLSITAENGADTTTIPLTVDIRTLDQSTSLPPTPSPTVTPAPVPAEDIPSPSFAGGNRPQRLTVQSDELRLVGRINNPTRSTRLTIRPAHGKWQPVAIKPNGLYKIRISDLPPGTTTLTLRIAGRGVKPVIKKIIIVRPTEANREKQSRTRIARRLPLT